MIALTLNVDMSVAKRGQILDVYPDKILGIVTTATIGTVIIMPGGTTIPVKESKEEILNKVSAFNNKIEPLTKET